MADQLKTDAPEAASPSSEAAGKAAQPAREADAAHEHMRSVPDRELLLHMVEELYDRVAAERHAAGADITSVLPLLTDEVVNAHRASAKDAASAHNASPGDKVAQGDTAPLPLPRVNAIWNHPLFQRQYRALCDFERDRPFCRHDLSHLLDVARLAWIENLERHLGFDRELVYAAALLHDVGKAEQYRSGIPHDVAGEKIASGILATLPEEASFTVVETRQILVAVRGHRHLRRDATPLERLVYLADKRSRTCFACRAADRCKWAPERRVSHIAC